jgi:hypothetical protein
MRHEVDPKDGLAELTDLWSAETPGDLHRVLVLYPPIRRSADAFEPFQLLAKHHETEPGSSIVTAVLLLTDRRWSKGVGQLVRRIEQADILQPAELDLLAETFAASDGAVYWEVPEDWFGEGGVVIDLDPGGPPLPGDAGELPDGPAVARREVFPPLRRWASSRLTHRDPTGWAGLLARGRDLGGRGGAALMSGLLDAIDSLPVAAQDLMVEAAIDWPDQGVRLHAFGLLAERHGPQVAHDRAIDDPSARVRSWANSILKADRVTPEGNDVGTGRDGGRAGDESGEQPSLF